MNSSMTGQAGKEAALGGHVQLFVYRVPEKNHDAMARLQNQLTRIYEKHGTIRSEFFMLSSEEDFMGFTNIAKTVSAASKEEVWVELDSYRNGKHRDEVVASVGQDEKAGALFGELMGLVSQGYSIVMGDFDRLKV